MWRRNERPSTFDGSTALGEKRRAREARSARDEGPTNASPKLVRYIQCHYCCWQVGHSAVSSVLCNDPQEMYLKERSSVYVARDPWLDTQTPNCGHWTRKWRRRICASLLAVSDSVGGIVHPGSDPAPVARQAHTAAEEAISDNRQMRFLKVSQQPGFVS
jgi:hypothetical protein